MSGEESIIKIITIMFFFSFFLFGFSFFLWHPKRELGFRIQFCPSFRVCQINRGSLALPPSHPPLPSHPTPSTHQRQGEGARHSASRSGPPEPVSLPKPPNAAYVNLDQPLKRFWNVSQSVSVWVLQFSGLFLNVSNLFWGHRLVAELCWMVCRSGEEQHHRKVCFLEKTFQGEHKSDALNVPCCSWDTGNSLSRNLGTLTLPCNFVRVSS